MWYAEQGQQKKWLFQWLKSGAIMECEKSNKGAAVKESLDGKD